MSQMDQIIGDGQARHHFWLRVTENYNNFRGNLDKRTLNQFKGHYKQVVDLKKSRYTENDVMVHAYAIWKEDEGKTSSKRTQISTKGDYTSSSNLKTNIGAIKSDTPSSIPRSIGKRSAERKMKGKRVATSSPIVDLTGMEAAIREKSEAIKNELHHLHRLYTKS
ncbi:hypothetical protein GmHk_11G032180 [Glycine max]|nr:hypothetical protein GmHk_11G032180 [Glycine max]